MSDQVTELANEVRALKDELARVARVTTGTVQRRGQVVLPLLRSAWQRVLEA